MTQETATATTRDALLDLASRCEAASGPDRELDGEVFRAIDMPLPGDFSGRDISLQWSDAEHCFLAPVGDMRVRYEQPRYTASVDSALGLVPEGWAWSIGTDCKVAWARAFPAPNDQYRGTGNREGASPALAICAAALRARAALA
jgi:hypothetical protein